MTLLTIAQDAADELGITRPTFVASNTDPDAAKLLRFANRVGNRLMKTSVWQALRGERTFTALNGEAQTGILPDDFDRFIPETFWDRSNQALVIGPITPSEWSGLNALTYSNFCARKFILREDSISVIPAFGGGEALAFEYVKNTWVRAGDGTTPKTRFDSDNDTSVIDEELLTYGVIFEYLDADGLPSQKALVAYENRFGVLMGNDQPSPGVAQVADIFGGPRRFNGAPPTNSFIR